MMDRDLQLDEPIPQVSLKTDLIFRGQPNWTAVLFFAGLSSLHAINCGLSFSHARIEGYMSLLLCAIFAIVTLCAYLTTYEMAVLSSEQRLRLRTGYKRFCYERSIRFADVQNVRLTLAGTERRPFGQIAVICELEDIECPPTKVPRQEALWLALAIGVRLVKVIDSPGSDAPEPERLPS